MKINIWYSSSVMSRVLMRLERVTHSWLESHIQGSRESQARLSRVTYSKLVSTILACSYEGVLAGPCNCVKHKSSLKLLIKLDHTS